MNIVTNIEKNERTTRMVIGAILIVGAILGFPRFFAILFGILLVVEGYLGWCAIPYTMEKLGLNKKSDGGTPPPGV
ncbi:MAG: hypothetical protein K0S08_155 [Gammaproteobacteria bacterium]|nr:hypothetical protein [Gammaproteobacteria bacterium]